MSSGPVCRTLHAAALIFFLFGAIASAQISGSPFACSATAAVPPTVRAEGLTELAGDLVLVCTGGTAIPAGTVIPQANFSLYVNTLVTSRVLGTVQAAGPNGLQTYNLSEALLLIDEPGGYPSYSPQLACGTPLTGCSVIATAGGEQFDGSPGRPNVYQGIVSGNSMQFFGIPVAPPGPSGYRVFRIVNLRANPSAIPVPPSGISTVGGLLSVSGSISVPINNPVQTLAFALPGLSFQIRKPDNSAVLTVPDFTGCVAGFPCPYGVLRFGENFATAAKLRLTPSPGGPQNVPGTIYNTESGFYSPALDPSLWAAGVADSGTRLKATFRNVPAGVHVWVGVMSTSSTNPPGGVGYLTQTEVGPYLQVAASETYPWISAAQLDTSSGSATAVWEVTSVSPLAIDNFDFPVWIVFDSGVTPSALNISGKAAPNQDNGAFTMPAGGFFQGPAFPVPRFTSAPPTPATLTLSPSQAPNTGSVTVVLSTNAYVPTLTSVTLSAAGLPDIPGTIVSSNGGLPAAVSFNLTGAAPGARDISVQPWATFPGAFTIVAAPSCSFRLGASTAQFGVAGGSGQVAVTPSSPQCTWTAAGDAPWLVVSPPTSSVILNYSVQANTDTSQRTGHIQVGGSGGPVLTVTQAGTATCTFTISPASQGFPAGGGSGNIAVTAGNGCPWSVSNLPAWVNVVSGASGSSNGTFSYTVPANAGGPRSATLGIGDKTFALSQAGSVCGAVDVTSQVRIVRGAFLGVPPLFQTFSQAVTLTNTGTEAIAGPIQYILDGLPRRDAPCPANTLCTVLTPVPNITTCQSASGSAMVAISSGNLAPGQTVSRTLILVPGPAVGGSAAALQYTPRVLSGTPTQ